MAKVIRRNRKAKGRPEASSAPAKASLTRRGRLLAAIALAGAAVLSFSVQRLVFLDAGPHADHPSQHPRAEREPGRAFFSPADVNVPSMPESLAVETRQAAARLVEVYPDSADALSVAGRIYYAFGDEDAAERTWEACLKMDPGCADAWHAMGEAAWERGDYREAADRLTRAARIDPELESRGAFLLADSLVNIGEAERAVRVLQRTRGPTGPTIDEELLLGQALMQLGEHEPAQNHFEQVLARESDSAQAHFGLSTVYARLGEPDKSQKHQEAYVRLKMQRVEEGRRHRAQSRDRDIADVRPLAGRCFLSAGKVHALHGDAREAERYWRRALELAPQSPQPRTLLRMLYVQQGRHEEALAIAKSGDLSPQPADPER
ncbi:MAG: tetratricopeptide repeat protein [Planctomycetes bacterium]|nr:tetratricopeptide repeat protein [Planctomycetota bacterium]